MMLATEFPGLRNGYAAVLPPGPNCGRPMYLAHYAALGAGLADLCVFKCGECAVLLSESADERRHV
jgi:hypothetical protein